jgi:hypothetical protein
MAWRCGRHIKRMKQRDGKTSSWTSSPSPMISTQLGLEKQHGVGISCWEKCQNGTPGCVCVALKWAFEKKLHVCFTFWPFDACVHIIFFLFQTAIGDGQRSQRAPQISQNGSLFDGFRRLTDRVVSEILLAVVKRHICQFIDHDNLIDMLFTSLNRERAALSLDSFGVLAGKLPCDRRIGQVKKPLSSRPYHLQRTPSSQRHSQSPYISPITDIYSIFNNCLPSDAVQNQKITPKNVADFEIIDHT